MASKKNEMATVNQSNALSVFSKVKLGSNVGFTGAETVTDKDGKTAYVVTNRTKEGEDIVTTYVPTKETADTLFTLDALSVAKSLTDVIRAYHFGVARNKEIWRDMGYKSFSAFAEGHANIKGATATLYARVADWFITLDENGAIDYRKAWLSNVPVSNLFPVLSVVEALSTEMGENVSIDTVLNELYDRFIDEGKLHIRFPQSVIKDEVNAIMGKDTKDAKDAKGSKDAKDAQDAQDANKALPNALTAYGIVEASVSEKLTEADNVDEVHNALALLKSILER